MSKPKIMVAVLTGAERQNWLNPNLAMNLVTMARDTRFEVYFFPVSDARPWEAARNMTVHAARQAGVDWLLSFDNDNFTDFNPLDIIASAGPNQHVITLSCGYKTSPSAYAFSCVSRPTSAVDGPFSEVADAFGGGVLMIRNTVWKKISRGPWFRWQHDNNEVLAPGPKTQGEDVYFAHLVRQNGFKVWTHQQRAGHYHTIDLTVMADTLLQRQGGQPERKPVGILRDAASGMLRKLVAR